MSDVSGMARLAPRRVSPKPAEEPEEAQTYFFAGDILGVVGLVFSPRFTSYEIFIRELVANAADAMSILKDYAPEKVERGEELFVRVTPDKYNATLTVEDLGIGMTLDELIDYLGTLGRSGSSGYMEYRKVANRSNPRSLHLIGKFGMGFYSVFRVVDYVRVISKSHLGTPQFIWESADGEHFTVQRDKDMEYGQLRRGTKVICHMKKNMSEYVDFDRVEELIFQHSDTLRFPVRFGMWQTERRGEKRCWDRSV